MDKEWKIGDKAGFFAYLGELEEIFVAGVISRKDEDGSYWVENDEAEWTGIEAEQLIEIETYQYYSFRSALKKNHFRVFAQWPQNWRARPVS